MDTNNKWKPVEILGIDVQESVWTLQEWMKKTGHIIINTSGLLRKDTLFVKITVCVCVIFTEVNSVK